MSVMDKHDLGYGKVVYSTGHARRQTLPLKEEGFAQSGAFQTVVASEP
jgi:hypothetical protein